MTNEIEKRAQKQTNTKIESLFMTEMTLHWFGKHELFSNRYWKSWLSECKMMKLESYLTPHIKNSNTHGLRLTCMRQTVMLSGNKFPVCFCLNQAQNYTKVHNILPDNTNMVKYK